MVLHFRRYRRYPENVQPSVAINRANSENLINGLLRT